MRSQRQQPLYDDVLLLRRIRLRAGLTAEAVALEMGVSTGTYAKWETGETKLTVERLLQLAEFFQRPVADFIVDGDGLSQDERQLVAMMRASSRNRTMLTATMRGLQEAQRNEFEPEPEAS